MPEGGDILSLIKLTRTKKSFPSNKLLLNYFHAKVVCNTKKNSTIIWIIVQHSPNRKCFTNIPFQMIHGLIFYPYIPVTETINTPLITKPEETKFVIDHEMKWLSKVYEHISCVNNQNWHKEVLNRLHDIFVEIAKIIKIYIFTWKVEFLYI